jgi:hypothetical protein
MTRRPTRSWLPLLFALGCSEAPATGWAELEGVGVLGVHDGGEAYLCGVGDAVASSRWLLGGKGQLEDADGLWQLTVEDDGAYRLSGSEGGAWSGVLEGFEEGGVYEGRPEDCRSGAVLREGELAGAFCDGAGTVFQVEPVDTFTGAPRALDVRVVGDPDRTFTMQRLP